MPLVVAPPAGRPARVLGGGPKTLAAVQNLLRAGWPVEVHEKSGSLGRLKGVRVSNSPPPTPALRQASMVLIGSACPGEWRGTALKALAGSGVLLWDENAPGSSTLRFPLWLPGAHLSLAAWSGAKVLSSWQATLAEDFLRVQEKLFGSFARLLDEVGGLVFKGARDEAFLDKAVAQLSTPEIVSCLARGEYDKAKMFALKVMASTTRSLDAKDK